MFLPKKGPGPKCRPWIQKSDPGLKNPPPGMKQQKLRTGKPCRMQSSEFQTEPYSASYGQKTILEGIPKNDICQGSNPDLKKGNPVLKKAILLLKV